MKLHLYKETGQGHRKRSAALLCFKRFTLQAVKSSSRDNDTHLMTRVRIFEDNMAEMPFARRIKTSTKNGYLYSKQDNGFLSEN